MNDTSTSEKIIIKPEVFKTEILLSVAEIEKEKEKILKNIQQNTSTPGFRPGKTPMSIIKKKYDKTAYYEGLEHLLETKTEEILDNYSNKILYYAHHFNDKENYNNTESDKKVELQFILKPDVNFNFKERELELIKYVYTDSQKKILCDYMMLFNLVNLNSVNKLEDFNIPFLINAELTITELATSEEEEKKKLATHQHSFYTHQYQSYHLNEFLPSVIEKNQTYHIDAKKWLEALQPHRIVYNPTIMKHIQTASECNNSQINFYIKGINAYPNFNDHLRHESIQKILNIQDPSTIHLDSIYNKLYEISDWIAEYFTEKENMSRFHNFVETTIQLDLPDDFLNLLYNSRIQQDEKEKYPFNEFKEYIADSIKTKVLRETFPAIYNESINFDTVLNLASRYYLVIGFLESMRLASIDALKDYLIYTLQSANESDRKKRLSVYLSNADTFEFTQRLSKNIKVITKTENINQSFLPYYLEILPDIFA